jgi:hypothetical protein
VDTGNIGLEGHSMGGWAVLAAAAESPEGYSAMVLEGSSTGPPFAADGTPTWPRNVAVVFSLYDEFADLMWGTDRAADVGNSAKLQALFATDTEIEPGRVYGDVAAGSARILFQPPVTHPGDHISRTAIGHSLDWFAKTLEGGRPLPANDQIWPFKELGTLLALIGFVVLVLGTIRLLLHSGYFQPLNGPPIAAHENRTLTWWLRAVFTAGVPVATFYLFFSWAESWLPPSAWFPQSITNQVMFWALANGVIVVAAGLLFPVRAVLSRPPMLSSLLLALITVATGYLAVFLADRFLLIDFRFWFVGMKALSLNQLKMAVIYLLPRFSAGRRIPDLPDRSVPQPVLLRIAADPGCTAEYHRDDSVRAADARSVYYRHLLLPANRLLSSRGIRLLPARHLVRCCRTGDSVCPELEP